ncbi:pentatricopeptide repeat-containing protein At2g17525, mitochondrial [Actinidia eriantha]|uniref:pentatricopeptide repeat-containing protein At2g17525, mitochondrial n=1 Tax=Actinidia eriantha TaxID=165200 RepID=UPI00258ECF48|nr:pentatricopeptide repeat-containing protein At2g17525, mitochondrial [Actinidia eriantha]XP_057491135.1 pentatricopeptide repeat-containing protein At2g17525, mitochondrial [Actinidia eriantha]XP_057491136.1 pentatricopeptide repeat-containing protein At2g17525, mitochondrial [Actinidia eriantha]
MPRISNASQLPIFSSTTTNTHRLIHSFQSKPISTSPVPTHNHIAHLILEQKSSAQALQTFRWASKLPNFTHSQSTYRALVHKLCVFRRFDTAHQVLDEMPSSIGSTPDEDIFVTIVRGLGRARMIREVIKVLDLVSKFERNPSLKLFNSILDVLVKEDIDLAREFYRKKMMGCGVRGDEYTFGILMKGLCLTNRIDEGFKLLAAMKNHGLTPNTVIYNTLLHGLCKNGKVGRARSLMNEVAAPNEVTFNILISAYCREENLVQALVMLEKSFHYGFVPDVVTVTKVIEILCNVGRISEAVEVLERVESKGGSVDVVAYNILIKGFCRTGKTKIAFCYLKEMENKGCLPNVDTYNALISGFCEAGMLDSALDMFREMKTAGISWNFVTYDTLIGGLCSGGRTKDGFKILELMEESKGGSGGRISPYNSVVYGLYKENRMDEAVEFLTKMGKMFPRAVDRSFRILGFCEEGSVENAKRVYDQMTGEGGVPSAIVYAYLIHGLCQKGFAKEAVELTSEMFKLAYFPIASTFNALINEFCSQGKVGSAIKFLEDMIGRGCLPNIGSYSPLVEAFCTKGDFQNALSLFLQMLDKGIVPDYSTWHSLVLCLSREKNLVIREKSLLCK